MKTTSALNYAGTCRLPLRASALLLGARFRLAGQLERSGLRLYVGNAEERCSEEQRRTHGGPEAPAGLRLR